MLIEEKVLLTRRLVHPDPLRCERNNKSGETGIPALPALLSSEAQAPDSVMFLDCAALKPGDLQFFWSANSPKQRDNAAAHSLLVFQW